MTANEKAFKPVRDLPPSKLKLAYDIIILAAIIIDLIIMALDTLAMSSAITHLSAKLSLGGEIDYYRHYLHEPLHTAGEFFTLFLIVELLVRWFIAIKDQRHYRWFFFPIIHWYEVLGCLPQLRALRLLRAIVIGHRLHQLGYQVLPKSWLEAGRFYFDMILEELSDRVILTAIGNVRQQLLSNQSASASLITTTLNQNRSDIESAIVAVLRESITPYLTHHSDSQGQSDIGQLLAAEVGLAVQDGLTNTPELSRYLKLIPIAGSLIESQLSQIGQRVGENVVVSLNDRLLTPQSLDKVLQEVAHGIVNINSAHPALESLIRSVIEDALDGLEQQVKIQQWKHHDYLKI